MVTLTCPTSCMQGCVNQRAGRDQLPDGQVDLGVEEGDDGDGKDAEYEEPGPVVVVDGVEGRGPQLGQVQVDLARLPVVYYLHKEWIQEEVERQLGTTGPDTEEK